MCYAGKTARCQNLLWVRLLLNIEMCGACVWRSSNSRRSASALSTSTAAPRTPVSSSSWPPTRPRCAAPFLALVIWRALAAHAVRLVAFLTVGPAAYSGSGAAAADLASPPLLLSFFLPS